MGETFLSHGGDQTHVIEKFYTNCDTIVRYVILNVRMERKPIYDLKQNIKLS